MPASVGVERAAAIGIFWRLANPQAAPFIPVDAHDFINEGFGSDEAQIKIGMKFDFSGGLGGRRGAAFGITEGVAEFTGQA